MHNLINLVKKYSLYIIAILLLISIFLVYLVAQKPNIQNVLEKYKLINPAYSLINSKDLIINFQPIRDYLTNTYQDNKDLQVSIYFEYLNTGANISVNKDIKMWPASLIKIPVAMAAMKKVQDGQWKLSNELVILDEDKDSLYGDLYREPTGTTHTIQDFIYDSVVNSDNTAHYVLLRNLESEDLENLYTHLGLESIIDDVKKRQTNFEDNKITAKSYSLFFRSLYNSTYLNPEYSQKFLDILSNSNKDYLAQAIPSDVKFCHKTGIRTDLDVFADSGIVYTPGRPYLITVMLQKKSKTVSDDKINETFKDISQHVYDYIQSYKE